MNAVYARREVERGSVSAGYLIHSGRNQAGNRERGRFFSDYGAGL